MTIKRKILYGLLLFGVLLLLCVVVAPGKAYARYNAAASWNTVVNAPSGFLPVLTEDNTTLTYSFPEATSDTIVAIQKMQKDGSYSDYTGEGLTVQSEGENIQIHMGEDNPPAGTYRMVITWKSEDADSASVETVTFFVNYSDG